MSVLAHKIFMRTRNQLDALFSMHHRKLVVMIAMFAIACGGQDADLDAGSESDATPSKDAAKDATITSDGESSDASSDVIEDWSNYDGYGYDGFFIPGCFQLGTTCSEPEVFRYACCSVPEHRDVQIYCYDGQWALVPDGGPPCP